MMYLKICLSAQAENTRRNERKCKPVEKATYIIISQTIVGGVLSNAYLTVLRIAAIFACSLRR